MADQDITEIGLDARGFEAGIQEVAEALKKYDIAVTDAVDATAKFNRQGELLEATVTKIEKDGTKVVQTFGQIKNSVISVTDGMGGLIKRFQDLNGNLTSLPTSFGLKSTKVTGASDPNANAAAFEQAKIAGALRAQQIDDNLNKQRLAFEEKKLAGARRAAQEDDRISKERLAKQEAEAKLLEDIYNDKLKDYRDYNKRIETEAKRALDERNKLEKKQNDEIVKNAIIRAKANADAQGKPSAVGQAAGSILNRATSILLSQAILEVNSAIQQSVTESVNFSKQLAAIGTISQNSTTSLDQFRAGIIEVSNAYGLSRKDVADGTYETISNQVAEGSQAILFQAQAAKLAQATLASQADSVNALSSILNSYNKSVNETDQISAAFFKTIDLGRLRLGDLSNTIGTVTVAASQLGVSYQEVFAGVAELTRQGVSAANAQTFLRNLFNQLIKPTEAVREVLDKYGFSTGQAAVQALGFQGVLKLLSKEAGGNIEKFGEFATNIRSLQALLGLAGDGGTKFDRSLKEITGSLGEFDKASQIVAQSTGKQFERITTTISNEFLKVGDIITKSIVSITNTLGGIDSVLDNTKGIILGFSATIVTGMIPALIALTATFPAATAAAVNFGRALFIGPLGALTATAAGIGVVAGIAAKLVSDTETAYKRALQIDTETNKLISSAAERRLKLIEQAQKAESQVIFKELAQINLKYSELEKTAIKTYQSIFEETNQFGSTLIASQNRIIRNLENENARSEKNLDSIRDQSAADQLKREQKVFEARLDGASLQLELTERTEQKARLLAQANEQVASGQNEAALKTLTLIDEQDVKILKLKDNVTKASKEYNNFLLDSVRNTFTQQEKIIDLTTNRMFKAFDNLKKALKDVNDSTGDRTGISGAFLKTFVKELDIATARSGASADRLRRNLDRLQSRGKAAILDQGTQDLLAQLDSSTVKELKYRIRIGDQESVARILDSIKEQQLLADENAKKQIANNQALFLEQTALSAAKRGDFETERKFLQEAAALRAKTTDDPIQSQQDFLTLNQRINDSFINQFTVKQKQTQEEATIFKQINSQIEAQGKINDTLVQRQAILEDIKVREQQAVKDREKEIAKQQENAVVLQKLFAQLGNVKINQNIKPSEALKEFNEISKEIDTIVAKLSTNPGDILKNEDLKLQLLNRLKKQEDALNKANALEEQKDRLAKIQQQVQLERDLRLKLNEQINTQQAKLTQEITETENAQKRNNAGSIGGFIDFALGNNKQIEEAKRLKEQRDTLRQQLEEITRIQKAVESANKSGTGLDIIKLDEKDQQKIRKIIDELSVANLTDEAKASLNLGTLFEDVQTRTQNLLDTTKQKLEEVKTDAEEPIEINLDTTTFDKQVEAQFEQAQQLKDLYASITIGAGGDAVAGDVPTTQFFANGGLVGGKAGNDANLARLTKGEFVINARSTKNNLSDLIAINSGAKTTTRNNNVNLNGISINLNSSGDAKVDARQIGDELSRLVKQGVLRLS